MNEDIKDLIIDKTFIEENARGELNKYFKEGTVFDYKFLIEETNDGTYFFQKDILFRGFVKKINHIKYFFPTGEVYTTEQDMVEDLKNILNFVEQGYCELTIKLY